MKYMEAIFVSFQCQCYHSNIATAQNLLIFAQNCLYLKKKFGDLLFLFHARNMSPAAVRYKSGKRALRFTFVHL